MVLNSQERTRLIQLGQAVEPKLRQLLTIVSYSTYTRWLRQLKNPIPKKSSGQPRTPEAIREFVIKLAQETGWGYTRILRELRKLGIGKIFRQTVVNILKKESLDPGPSRGPGTWDQLVKMHAETLWQCDFFSKRMLCRRGNKQVCVLELLLIGLLKQCTVTNSLDLMVASDFLKANTAARAAIGMWLKGC